MTWLPPLVVVGPLVAAGMLIGVLGRVRRAVAASLTTIVSFAALAGCCVLLAHVLQHGPVVVWYGGWHPGNVVGLGIAFAVDLASAAIAVVIALVVCAVVVFSADYFDEVGAIFYVLVLAMLGAMLAFAYAADAFDLFVFYEVFSVAAYALSAYRIETDGAFTGALQFALTNTIAGLFILVGIILLEGRTGELNLAAIGHALASEGPARPLTALSLACVGIGLFTRGALAPLHFWFDEVHAHAPSPLCAILTGAMAPLALYGFARFYWTVYSATMAPGDGVTAACAVLGTVSAIVGSLMCLRESHIKRAIAFSTVAHGGVVLVALGAFSASALCAAALYAVSYAIAAAGLFMTVAIVRRRTHEADLRRLIGRGRAMPLTAVVFFAGVISVAALWPSERMALGTGPYATLYACVAGVVSCATGGAFFTAWWRIFIAAPLKDPNGGPRNVPWFMLTPATVLVAVPLVLSSIGSTRTLAAAAARAFVDRDAYTALLMHGVAPGFSVGGALPLEASVVPALLGTLAVTVFMLAPAQPLVLLRRRLRGQTLVTAVHHLHCGNVGDYVAWIVGTAAAVSIVLMTFAVPR